MVGVASFGAALGLPGPRAAGKPANRSAGQVPESWIGKKAVIKWSAPLMEGDRVVGDNVFRVYTVDRVDGDRVELAADGIVGWIQAEDVVLLDQAIDFYSKVIQGNEKHLAARVKRAQVREYLGDRAKAIAELTEAIEIGPPNAVVHAIRADMFRSEQATRQGHRRLERGHPAHPILCQLLHRPGTMLGREAGLRQGHRRLR